MNGKNGGSRFQEGSFGESMKQGWSDIEEKLNETVTANPGTSLLIGMGAGLVTGLLLAQLLRSGSASSYEPQYLASHFESAKKMSQNVMDTVRKSISDAFSHLT